MIPDLDIWRGAAVVICASIPHLMVASSLAMADVATPSLASVHAMSVASLSGSETGCSIDSPRINDVLGSVVDGPGFPEVTHISGNAVYFEFLVIVTVAPQSKTPDFNPAARDPATFCRVSGRAVLRHSDLQPKPESPPDIVYLEPEEAGNVIWRAVATPGEDLSPSSVDANAERIIRELAERFSADWRQSQGR